MRNSNLQGLNRGIPIRRQLDDPPLRRLETNVILKSKDQQKQTRNRGAPKDAEEREAMETGLPNSCLWILRSLPSECFVPLHVNLLS